MPAIRVKAVDAPPFLRVKGLGGGAPVFEAWTTPSGSVNAAITAGSIWVSFDTNGQQVPIEPWNCVYTVTDICTTINGKDVWTKASELDVGIVYSSELRLALVTRTNMSISKFKYTVDPIDYSKIQGTTIMWAGTYHQVLGFDKVRRPNYGFYYNTSVIFPDAWYDSNVRRMEVLKVTNAETGETLPWGGLIEKEYIAVNNIWFYQIYCTQGGIPTDILATVEFRLIFN